MKILVVDDSRTARLIIKKIIGNESKHEFADASNGKEAIEIFEVFNPDITLMDLTMPVMDGFQALEQIRKSHPAALVIILSADVQKQAISRAMELGAFKFLKKPPQQIDIQQVLAETTIELQNRR